MAQNDPSGTDYAIAAAAHGWPVGHPIGSKVTVDDWLNVLRMQPRTRPQTLTIATALAAMADSHGVITSGAGELGRNSGVRFDTARTGLRDLRRLGWIQYAPQRHHLALSVPPERTAEPATGQTAA